MEQVLRWRLTNSAEVRMTIPEPFRPTTLQCKRSTHPVVIDFINWPSIRDQMILLSHKIDLDAMCRDLVLNTVVEAPHRRIAISVHDILFKCVLPRVQGPNTVGFGETSMLFNPKWVYLTVNSPYTTLSRAASSIEDALAMEIADRFHQRSTEALGGITRPLHEATAFGDEMTRGFGGLGGLLPDMLSSFGIDRVEKWRLSRAFARKYPYMNCSSGEAPPP